MHGSVANGIVGADRGLCMDDLTSPSVPREQPSSLERVMGVPELQGFESLVSQSHLLGIQRRHQAYNSRCLPRLDSLVSLNAEIGLP